MRWVLERGVKTIDYDGVEWLDGIIFDITERRAAEQLRLQTQTEAARVEELEASRYGSSPLPMTPETDRARRSRRGAVASGRHVAAAARR